MEFDKSIREDIRVRVQGLERLIDDIRGHSKDRDKEGEEARHKALLATLLEVPPSGCLSVYSSLSLSSHTDTQMHSQFPLACWLI